MTHTIYNNHNMASFWCHPVHPQPGDSTLHLNPVIQPGDSTRWFNLAVFWRHLAANIINSPTNYRDRHLPRFFPQFWHHERHIGFCWWNFFVFLNIYLARVLGPARRCAHPSCIEPRLVGRQHLLRFSMPFKDICTTIKAENVVLNFLPSPIIMVKMLLKGASTTFRLPFFLLLL